MIRKQQVEERLDQLQLSIDRLKSGVVTPDGSSIAVDAFLNKKITFTQISELIEIALNGAKSTRIETIDDILAVNKNARTKANELLKGPKFA